MMASKNNTPLMLGVFFMMIAGIIALFGVTQFTANNAPTPTPTYDPYSGIVRFDEPRTVSDFTLTDQNGEEFRLSSLQGKYALLFFGFTHCPDVCPLTVAESQQIQRQLGDLAEGVQFVFISVDGKRDTAAVLKTFLEVRNASDFIGLMGDPETVRTIAAEYGAVFEYDEPDASGNYSVSHTAKVFILDPSGKWIMEYLFGSDVLLVAELLETKLNAE